MSDEADFLKAHGTDPVTLRGLFKVQDLLMVFMKQLRTSTNDRMTALEVRIKQLEEKGRRNV